MDLPAQPVGSLILSRFPVVDMAAGLVVAVVLLVALGYLDQVGWATLPAPLYWLVVAGQAGLLIAVGMAWTLRSGSVRHTTMGWANRVTLVRALMVMTVAAFIAFPSIAVQQAWWLVGLSVAALSLDGVDGWVARRTGCESAFGARFDMEMDALFMLVLAALVVTMDVAGVWVLALGSMRYVFVAAGWYWSWLQAPLPDSFRRKWVCVWQIATLVICLVPVVPGNLASGGLILALALLGYSFAVDAVWLHAHRSVKH